MSAALYGLMAQYPTEEALLAAVHRVRAAWRHGIEAYAPFAVEGLAEALGSTADDVAPWTLAGGIVGGAGAFFMQWYSAVVSYPINVGGRPLNSWPAFIPITFELTILGAALAAVIAMLAKNGLPRLVHPLFGVAAFNLASRNRFFLVLLAGGDAFDADAVRQLLQETGAELVCEVPA